MHTGTFRRADPGPRVLERTDLRRDCYGQAGPIRWSCGAGSASLAPAYELAAPRLFASSSPLPSLPAIGAFRAGEWIRATDVFVRAVGLARFDDVAKAAILDPCVSRVVGGGFRGTGNVLERKPRALFVRRAKVQRAPFPNASLPAQATVRSEDQKGRQRFGHTDDLGRDASPSSTPWTRRERSNESSSGKEKAGSQSSHRRFVSVTGPVTSSRGRGR